MLPKKKRLTTEAFNRFFSSGRRHHTTHLQVIYSLHPNFHGSVVVGKKVFKSAVKRNRLRRQLYSTLYRSEKPSGVFIIIVKPASKEVQVSLLNEEMVELLEKIESTSKSR